MVLIQFFRHSSCARLQHQFEGSHLKASAFVQNLRKKFSDEYEIGGDAYIANRLGVSLATLRSWAKSEKELAPFQIANALSKSHTKAVSQAQFDAIKPIVEFYEIDCNNSKHASKVEVLPQPAHCSKMQKGVRDELLKRSGLYIFYDSRGKALYVGKARKQNLWKEMNLAYNRARGEVQMIKLVSHPERNQDFKPAYSHSRQPKDRQLELHALAAYFSAYWVTDGMIDDLEALLVRGFANDLLNARMEKFTHLRAAQS